RSRLQKRRNESYHASRFTAFVRDAVHRDRRGYSNGFALARAQKRRCIGNENLRTTAPRAQHYANPTPHVCTHNVEPASCDPVSGKNLDEPAIFITAGRRGAAATISRCAANSLGADKIFGKRGHRACDGVVSYCVVLCHMLEGHATGVQRKNCVRAEKLSAS